MSIDLFALVVLATVLICAVTLMSGFGVGTLLTPVFTMIYDIKTAVFLVAIIHLTNNLFKCGLFAKYLEKKIFLRFGVISIVGAVVGSLFYGSVNATVLKVILGMFLVLVGVHEFLPFGQNWTLPRHFDFVGGFASGLLGGLIGNQGAIRSAYLLNYQISKETFVATAASIAILIDVSRIPVYVLKEMELFRDVGWGLGIVAVAAIGGTFLGKKLLSIVSLQRFRALIGVFLIATGILFVVSSIMSFSS